MLHWNEYLKLFVGLLAVISPITNIPVFLGLTSSCDPQDKKRIVGVASAVAASVLILFLITGEHILSFLGIGLPSFRIAGGLLLLISALSMMKQTRVVAEAGTDNRDPMSVAIVPLAVPLLAGPGAISTIIVYAHRQDTLAHLLASSAVILAITFIIYITFTLAPRIESLLGEIGMTVASRIMGLALAAIGIEFMAQGLLSLFPGLR